MFTKFHYNILLHSLPSSKRLFQISGVPRQGAHSQVRAPPRPPPSSSSKTTMASKRDIMMPTNTHSITLLLIILLCNFIMSFSESDAQILLRFRESLNNTEKLSNWDALRPPCNGWNGVLCEKGRVWGLQLENMGLQGVIDVETLAKLPDLRSVSFMNNDFDSSLPNFTRLGALKTIFLSNNKFSGEIPPDAFNGMLSLKKLHLANNRFSGPVPATLASLPRLMELTLQNNEFDGEIPRFNQDGLKVFNVSNNRLVGEIPQNLSHVDASSFSGNDGLCGAPLEPCPSPSKKAHIPIKTIAIVAVVVGAALIALVILLICLICRKKKSHQPETAPSTAAAAKNSAGDLNRMERGQAAAAAGSSSPDHAKTGVKLTFLKEGVEKFDMQDLLKASAEVLGGGAFGSTYKAALDGGSRVMVVKRIKHMNNVSKEDFNEHMRRLGRLNHQNVLPIVAFYYRKEEKLLVAEYAQNLSLAVRLHGTRSGENPSLDWPTRLNIAKGVAKGLLYLHNELPSLTAAHGHLKSSNVLLDASYKPLLADYGLIPIVNKEQAEAHLISYKSPEYKDGGRLTKKTDVWSLGVLILEILTGKVPSSQGGGNEADLATWVESAIRDESGGAAVVFDQEMAGAGHGQGEMMKLLNVGLSCCNADVEGRPEIREVVERIEEIKEKDFDDDFYSSYASETDMRSSRGLSDDFKSINM